MVETEDKDGIKEAEQMPDKSGAGANDYHDDGTGIKHNHQFIDYDAITICREEDNNREEKFKCPMHDAVDHEPMYFDTCDECAIFLETKEKKKKNKLTTTTTTDLIHEDGSNHTLPKVKTTGNSYVKQRIIQKIGDDYEWRIIDYGNVKKLKQINGNDYHDTGFPHTNSREDNASALTTLEAGKDYHDTGYYHTHGPDSQEGNIGGNEDIGKTLEDLLAKIPTKKRTGKDYHDTGFAHTHRPKGRRNNKRTRNKKRKTSKKRTPKRMRPRWSNVH